MGTPIFKQRHQGTYQMDMLNFNIWSFLLIMGIGPGALLCMVLLLRRPSHAGHKFLGTLLLILTLNLLEFLLLSSSYYKLVPHLTRVTHPLVFLIGPLFYLYVVAQLRPQFRLSKHHLAHLIPCIMAALYFIPWYLKPAAEKLAAFESLLQGPITGISLKGFIFPFLHISVTIIYTVFALKALRHFRKSTGWLQKKSKKNLRFHLRFGKVFLAYWALQMTGLIASLVFQYYVYYVDYMLALANAFFIQGLAAYFLFNPYLYLDARVKERYLESPMSEDMHKALLEKITHFMEQEKLYLDSNLTLDQFSKAQKLNKNYVSQVINAEFGYGFNEYINQFRVQKAKELLADPALRNQKLIGIAFDVGFNNKTTFHRVFRAKTGKTPAEYREAVLNHQQLGHNL